ncbi:MAG: RimK/LysX family protein [Epsilonproteobacteria bacterium]|nr:RimK/LysX family protein [Campylobacterota bacterium]
MFKIFFYLLFCFQGILFSLDVIGNFEPISLDEFNATDIQAKIDTGAFYSSLHCSYIKELDDEMVEFSPLMSNEIFKKKIYKKVSVKSSNGISEKRFLIASMITIATKSYPILFSLTNRNAMNYKILIGTNFLKDRFLVDVGKENLKY